MIEEILKDTIFLEKMMGNAIELAQKSLPEDIPVGALIIDPTTRKIISRSGNTREHNNDPTEHAEVVAVRQACKVIGDWRLNNHIVITTLEPCIMCAGVLTQARIGGVVYGARDPQYGAAGSIYNFFVDPRLNHNTPVIADICNKECRELLDSFFASKRS